jgi:hypothetical protein
VVRIVRGAHRPFISVALDSSAAASSTDPWLSTIATGKPGLPGVQRAPDIGTFDIPNRLLVSPRPTNTLSLSETELVVHSNDIRPYLTGWKPNPH